MREKPLFWKGVPGKRGPSCSVLDGRYRLLTDMKLNVLSLFDVTVDPLEQNDLKESQAEVVEKLLSKLRTWQASLPTKPDSRCFSKYRAKDAGPAPEGPEGKKPAFRFDPSR